MLPVVGRLVLAGAIAKTWGKSIRDPNVGEEPKRHPLSGVLANGQPRPGPSIIRDRIHERREQPQKALGI